MATYSRSSIQNINNRRLRIWKNKFIIKFNRKQRDIDKIYLYAKDPFESKNQYLINKREGVSINHFNDPKAFIEYSNDMHDVYKNIDEYNPDKENKILIAFGDMIADMIHNKKLNSVVTELFIRGRKLNISLVFITKSYFKVPKDVRLILATFLLQKFQIKENFNKLQYTTRQTLILKILLISIENVQPNHIIFLVIDTMLASNNPLRLRKNIFNIYNTNHDN